MPSRTSSSHSSLSPPTQLTPLLEHSISHQSARSGHTYHRPSCQQEECEHGLLSPHVSRPTSSDSNKPPRTSSNDSTAQEINYTPTHLGYEPQHTESGNGGEFGGRHAGETDLRHGILGDALADGVLGSGMAGQLDESNDGKIGRGGEGRDGEDEPISTTQWLARKHRVRGRRVMYVFLSESGPRLFSSMYSSMLETGEGINRLMVQRASTRYLAYYFPFLQWITQYKWAYLQGDLIAALTMASFYIPMSLSYASNLGHIPPINGLYSFVFNPFIYALLGSCPQMVVGPEAAGSLLVGTVVRSSVDSGHSGDEDDTRHAIIAGVVTGMAGAIIFVAGLTRLGFLDSVLSRPFLRGFISAIGFVIFVDQLIPEMGLNKRANHDPGGVSHGSSAAKIAFLVMSVKHAHRLTTGVAFGSFAIIMVCRCVVNLDKDRSSCL